MHKRTLIASAALVMLLFSVSTQSAWWPFSNDDDAEPTGEITEIAWDDLVPEDFIQPENPFMTMSQEEIDKLMDGSDESNEILAELEKDFNYAPVVEELDGKRVKLPAYITPLDFEGQSLLKEFLLVPYIGACIHVPPPPANQVVHANSKKSVEFKGMYEPVWAIGTIRTETTTSDLAESGYKLEVEKVMPYVVE